MQAVRTIKTSIRIHGKAHPDFNVLPVQEKIKATSMIKMQMSNNDLLNIFYFIPGRLNGSIQLVLRVVLHSGENIRELRAPYLEFQAVLASVSASLV